MMTIFNALKKEKWLVGLIVVLLIALLVAYWFSTQERDRETGGTGGYDKNTVTILGWEKKTSDDVELGEIISQTQYEQLTNLISQKVSEKYGEFDYEEADIEDQIENRYDKPSEIDQTVFYIKLRNSSDRFKITLDHNLNTANLSE